MALLGEVRRPPRGLEVVPPSRRPVAPKLGDMPPHRVQPVVPTERALEPLEDGVSRIRAFHLGEGAAGPG